MSERANDIVDLWPDGLINPSRLAEFCRKQATRIICEGLTIANDSKWRRAHFMKAAAWQKREQYWLDKAAHPKPD